MIASSMMQEEDVIMLWAIWVILCWMGLVVISAAIATVVGRFLGWEEEP
jgi:small neutral amino acid transporter SnatA (MarC family)